MVGTNSEGACRLCHTVGVKDEGPAADIDERGDSGRDDGRDAGVVCGVFTDDEDLESGGASVTGIAACTVEGVAGERTRGGFEEERSGVHDEGRTRLGELEAEVEDETPDGDVALGVGAGRDARIGEVGADLVVAGLDGAATSVVPWEALQLGRVGEDGTGIPDWLGEGTVAIGNLLEGRDGEDRIGVENEGILAGCERAEGWLEGDAQGGEAELVVETGKLRPPIAVDGREGVGEGAGAERPGVSDGADGHGEVGIDTAVGGCGVPELRPTGRVATVGVTATANGAIGVGADDAEVTEHSDSRSEAAAGSARTLASDDLGGRGGRVGGHFGGEVAAEEVEGLRAVVAVRDCCPRLAPTTTPAAMEFGGDARLGIWLRSVRASSRFSYATISLTEMPSCRLASWSMMSRGSAY